MKQEPMQAAINTHLSQPVDAGASAGQQGIAATVGSAADMSTVAEASGRVPAMTGRDSGLNTRPATSSVASIRFMAAHGFTAQSPTDGSELKVPQANDAVMTK